MPSPRDPVITSSAPSQLRALTELAEERLSTLAVVATDVDGTLTADGKLGAGLLTALAGLARAGILVIPISGRPAGEVQGLCRWLPGVHFGVAENGLVEIEPGHAPRWLSAPTDIGRLHAVGEHLNRDHAADLRPTGDVYCRLGDIAYERDGRDEAELLRLRQLAQAQGVFLIWSNVHIHLSEHDPDKGAGLLVLLERRGIDPSKVVTIGDAPNDNGLFEPGRFGLTVGTADVIAQRTWFRALPEFVTAGREVEGFRELAERLCARRLS
jgi:hydroxymethylpyrimidine pyrophosphatase-like HAD family hydrolase